jgi:hypothetical protein
MSPSKTDESTTTTRLFPPHRVSEAWNGTENGAVRGRGVRTVNSEKVSSNQVYNIKQSIKTQIPTPYTDPTEKNN